jgi:hypothetical protein
MRKHCKNSRCFKEKNYKTKFFISSILKKIDRDNLRKKNNKKNTKKREKSCWTGPGLIKDRLWKQPGQTRATRRVNPEPGWPGRTRTRPGFFFVFKCGIWNPLVYILYVSMKKTMFFQCGIKIFWFKYFNLKG